jgi:uncharacterized RDD family membrane protein YckC
MNINCSYCRAPNAVDDQRCHRCGRRLHVTPPQVLASGYGVSQTATARALRPSPELGEVAERLPQPGVEPPPRLEPPARLEPNAQPRRAAYQRSLFGPSSQIVPFESIAPRTDSVRARREIPKLRSRGPIPGQQSLGFMAPAQPLDTELEARIYCDAQVAIVAHRVIAAAVDLSVVAIALGVFIGIVQLVCGQVMFSRDTVPIYLVIAAIFGLLYKVLWSMANGDSPGMRFAHLRLVNFDGRRPDREQRLLRSASGCLSFMAAGLGVVWALVDEESLTWHDHISKTFPTPH